ncbi:MAG: glutamine--tRNA ligase/YqeY domain fusion protein [Pseudomonadales bacterium]|jgi:glutaminyl-tRNA synthetase|nr:glutamine--tRNA ligase/YqeY domain fusion protein [Pseudomonadales bacterium]
MSEADAGAGRPEHFIEQIIRRDVEAGKHGGAVVTRFPPEPNGFLHIGHVKSICLNFGVAEKFGGRTFLRMDDTNPLKEEDAFVRAIQRDVEWLGFSWGDRETHASDYFERLYEFAEALIRSGHAYVDSQSNEEIRAQRGTLTEPGVASPFRDRGVEENLELFRKMRAGAFEDGSQVLRAKIDMASGNINLRDPVIYRIRHATHQRTGDAWCVYPMYDYTHCLSDHLEGITHSLCTLEFEDHRPLYDWVLDTLGADPHPQQIEFSRLQLEYTVLSKRNLAMLVAEGHVEGWDDPRMPTVAGLRRRGVTPAALREFCDRIGITKSDGTVEMSLLERVIRDDLEAVPRGLGVLDPLKVVITNLPEDHEDWFEAPNHPKDDSLGTRRIPFTKELWIDADDFMEDPPGKYKRLAPGREVRLRHGYIIRCDEVVHGNDGQPVELRCSADLESRAGGANADRKVKGVIHWVSARHGVHSEVRLYDRLFTEPNPGALKDGRTLVDVLNPESLVVKQAVVEPHLVAQGPGLRVQFERTGYFFRDPETEEQAVPVFNRIITLRDTWAKIEAGKAA